MYAVFDEHVQRSESRKNNGWSNGGAMLFVAVSGLSRNAYGTQQLSVTFLSI